MPSKGLFDRSFEPNLTVSIKDILLGSHTLESSFLLHCIKSISTLFYLKVMKP